MSMKKQVEEILNGVRPSLQADGGDVALVDIDEEKGIVKVKLIGACSRCPMSVLTLQEGIENILKSKVEGVKEVVGV